MAALLVCIGAVIGAILGLTGAGGSVIAVPILLLTLNLPPSQAMGLSLGVVAVSSLYGSWQRIAKKEVLWIAAILFMASGMLLAPLGRVAAGHINDALLIIGFAVVSASIALKMYWQSIKHPEQAHIVRATSDSHGAGNLLCRFGDKQQFDWRFRCMAGLSVGGIATGFLSGLFGVGGGFLIVPFLNQLNGMSMRHSVATSLVIIAGIASSGFVSHALLHEVNWQQLGFLGAGGIIGMTLGNMLAKKIAGVTLQRIFSITILVMTAILIIH